jgi:DNA-binding CsgD family transcriptional regulator
MSLLAAWAAVALQVPRRVADARRRLAPLAGLEGRTPAERQVLVQQVYVAASTNQPATTIKALAERVIGDWESAEQDPESGDWVWPRLFLGRIGAVATACSLADAGYARAEARGSVAGMIAASFVRAFTEEDSGGLVEAEDHYRAMLVHHDGALMIQMLGHCGLAQTLALQGRTGEARDVLAQFPDPLPPETPAGGAALIWAARARLCHAEGDFDGAVSAADELRRLLGELGADSPTWISWRPLTVDALRSLGRLTEARALAREHLELCERSGVPHLVGEALGARAGVAEGPDLAIDLARRGVQLLSPTESLLRLGNAQLTLGALLRRNGSKVAARDHLRVAVELLDRCGASPAAAFAREELAATGVRLPRTALLLTPSERRVAELALAGLSNPEIGARLHVTRKTVETHLSAAYRKLGISGREDLRAEHLVLGR